MVLDLDLPPAELALQLVNISSVSGEEQALAGAIGGALSALPHLTCRRDGDTVVAQTSLGRRRRVIVAGHLDTVPVAGNLPGRLADGRLWGRGSVDMKGGLAAMLAAAVRLDSPASDVTWVFYDNEEVAQAKSGLGRVQRHHPDWLAGDFAILCEPTNARLEGGCNGTIRVVVRAHGTAAHSARPWMGVNAIHGLVPALGRLVRFEPATVRVDGLDYREALNAVGIEGGTAPNVIPDRAAVTVNYRFAPDKPESEARRILEALFEGYQVEVVDSAPSARPGLTNPAAGRLAAITEAHGGGPAIAKEGWTDVARFYQAGIPAVNLGPGDPSLAHQDDEACPAEQIGRVADILVEYLVRN
ncbi:MAG: succinyl-diaminopimelate desuccinylase [Bifidobacteriaceae bacterium]|jgi:succinyl-diaminopimelate desuccinylase|nr:succinyl-diaminopimelate desuccinylase [Bifidobacteriaceae bacterium]